METFVFDACAMIAFFAKETGGEKIKTFLIKAARSECLLLMHNASVAELYYDALRSAKKDGEAVLASLTSFPITYVADITIDMIKWIGYFKTTYKISFADSFVLATAKLHNAKVVTSDHHEFDVIDKRGDIGFDWIR